MKSYLCALFFSALVVGCGGIMISPTAATLTRTATSIPTKSAVTAPITTAQPTAPSTLALPDTSAPTETATPVPPTRVPPTATNIPATVAPTDQPTLVPSTHEGTRPTFVNHPRPAGTVNFSVFENAGCAADSGGHLSCEPTSPLGALGCDEIAAPSDLASALVPNDPIALCFVVPFRRSDRTEPEPDTYFYRAGGLIGQYARLVIWRNNRFELVQTFEELAEAFAPIESPAEALALALAATPFTAEYGLRYEPELEYLADTIEDTFAKPEGDGYLVQLFSFAFFGCGPHATSSIELHVARDGTIEQIATRPLFNDPKMDGLCVD